jgi:hypothetical protein
MSHLGIGNGCMAEPYVPLAADEREKLEQALSELRTRLQPLHYWSTCAQS